MLLSEFAVLLLISAVSAQNTDHNLEISDQPSSYSLVQPQSYHHFLNNKNPMPHTGPFETNEEHVYGLNTDEAVSAQNTDHNLEISDQPSSYSLVQPQSYHHFLNNKNPMPHTGPFETNEEHMYGLNTDEAVSAQNTDHNLEIFDQPSSYSLVQPQSYHHFLNNKNPMPHTGPFETNEEHVYGLNTDEAVSAQNTDHNLEISDQPSSYSLVQPQSYHHFLNNKNPMPHTGPFETNEEHMYGLNTDEAVSAQNTDHNLGIFDQPSSYSLVQPQSYHHFLNNKNPMPHTGPFETNEEHVYGLNTDEAASTQYRYPNWKIFYQPSSYNSGRFFNKKYAWHRTERLGSKKKPKKARGQYKDPHCIGGRDGIVHLFEWKWNDIASECENFLGPYGFCGVQTSPANENRVVTDPNRPWWERYQPVSYKLQTRSGNENEFKSMVQRCNAAGVRIYVDVVINHMTGVGGTGQGTGGSSYDANSLQFPGVPYGPTDFNDGSDCHTSDLSIHNYQNAEEVRNCRLVGLLDLNTGKDYVRGEIAGYLNHLVDLGVAGFRVDAAKHMWPDDIKAILGRVKDVGAGGRPFVYQEVIDQGGEPIKGEQYFASGRVTNFKFGLQIANVFRHQNPMKYLSNWGVGWGMWDSENVVNFVDNHDNQRGHGGGGSVLTHWEPKPYKMATAFMLAHPYGMPRIMSSYEYNRANDYEGPPHNGDMSIRTVGHSGMSCEGGWSCEHRWRQIYNMVAFRNNAAGTPISNWWSGADYKIAFSRGNKAFIALNLESSDINQSLQTGLPSGTYCDIISGDLVNGACTGKSVSVNGDGKANINVCGNCDDPVLAIHVGAKVGSPYKRYG